MRYAIHYLIICRKTTTKVRVVSYFILTDVGRPIVLTVPRLFSSNCDYFVLVSKTLNVGKMYVLQ